MDNLITAGIYFLGIVALIFVAEYSASIDGIKTDETRKGQEINYAMGSYPCIKCNIGRSESGETKIYHLPFDQQYDATKIKNRGEFYAMTVKEAEDAGFRRTFKWFGNK